MRALNIDISSLPAGNYTLDVWDFENTDGSTYSNYTNFTINRPAPATINVSSNLAGAGWVITGPPNYAGIGSVSPVDPSGSPPGTYTITGDSISCYSLSYSPNPQTQTVASGATITFTPNYTYTCSPPPTADIKANGSNGPITIAYNIAATISWSSTNASSCSVSPTGWTGTSNGGISTGNLTSSKTYSLSCTGSGGNASDSVTINVTSPPGVTADIKANGSDGPIAITYNTSATISWTSVNATSCTVSPPGWSGTSGSQNTL